MAVNAVSQELVQELRSTFLKEVSEKGPDAVHPKDLERAKTDDHWLKRFISHNEGDTSMALKMLWGCVTWRKEFGVNDINEKNIKMDLIIQGGLFPYGKDIDGKTLLVFRGKKHSKSGDQDEMKRVVVYWFERIERMTKGDVITIFFDMEGCGLSNMDMEFIKYLIGLFKEYYPYFLNYIIIFEMPWILTAAFKIVKSWLPEKAVEKIKFVTKKDIKTYVPLKEALVSWGGESDYVFRFIPEDSAEKTVPELTHSKKQVHFVDSTLMSEISTSTLAGDKEDGPLKVNPSGIITFVDEANELISVLELRNSDVSAHVSFKIKTTSPEKFRVKPCTGTLSPGAHVKVTVTLLPGFQLGGLSKDKFLVMSTIIDEKDPITTSSDVWKNIASMKIYEHRLKCVQTGETAKNGTIANHAAPSAGDNGMSKLCATLKQVANHQRELSVAFKRLQYAQLALQVILVVMGAAILYLFSQREANAVTDHSYCPKNP